MTLREIQQRLTDCKQDSNLFEEAMQELEMRVDLLEKVIEDGINLNDHFILQFIWQGGPDDVN